MIKTIKTNSSNLDFIQLVKYLDAELAERDGVDHSFYDQFNKIDQIKYALVAYENGRPLGCGAIKEFSRGFMEIKRMYVLPESRRGGIAMQLVTALQDWASELGYQQCILETGKKQPEAIGLYLKCGFNIIPNYGQYIGVANSVCFGKMLR